MTQFIQNADRPPKLAGARTRPHLLSYSLSRLRTLFLVAPENLAGLEVDEMDSGTGEASHRFIIVIMTGCEFDAMLHALVGYGAGEEYVLHHILATPLVRPWWFQSASSDLTVIGSRMV